jgi:large subunit ribosomal protein L18
MNSTTLKRQKRTRAKLKASKDRPRLSVFRSNKFIYAQIIDDENGKTLVGVSEKELKEKGIKTEKAKKLGEILAKKAIAKKIKTVVFDRGSYGYHGRVKAFAEGAREGGLVF